MTHKTFLKITLAVFSLILFSGAGVAAQTVCTTPDDVAIVKEIYKKMKVRYKSQMKHVNVRSTGGIVTLEGWATNQKIKTAIEKIAAAAKCVKSVDNKLYLGLRTGCGPGQKKCGSICIALEETCNICTLRTCN
jgi:hypothetical protein